jgi:hypothetical protein
MIYYFDMEKIGSGSEKNFYLNGNNPNKLEAVYKIKKTEEEIKATFYFSKLLSILFPSQIAKIYKAGNEKEIKGGKSKYIVERVELSDDLKELAKLNNKYHSKGDMEDLTTKEHDRMWELEDVFSDRIDYIEILQSLRQLGSQNNTFNNFPDTGNAGNVSSFGEDAVYLDLTSPFEVQVATPQEDRVTWKVQVDKLYDLAENLEGENRRLAEVYIDRIEELYKQAKEKAGSQSDRK